MKKEIKDYLHLYLGCDYQDQFGGLGNINEHTFLVMFDAAKRNVPFKLLLRPLSDMSEDEKLYIVEAITYSHVRFSSKDSILGSFDADRYNKKHNNELYPDEFLYLLKQGFDLFGLIESGLAIDKTKTLTKTSQV